MVLLFEIAAWHVLHSAAAPPWSACANGRSPGVRAAFTYFSGRIDASFMWHVAHALPSPVRSSCLTSPPLGSCAAWQSAHVFSPKGPPPVPPVPRGPSPAVGTEYSIQSPSARTAWHVR